MVQAVDRALRLLREVARHPEGIGVRALARKTGLKAPTAQNLLKTLLAQRFLDFDPDTRRYSVGISALQLAETADPFARLARFSRPYTDRLYAELGETVAVLTMHRGTAVVVQWRQSNRPLAVTHSRRAVDHPHLMASGLVLLAFQEPAFRQAYVEQHLSEDSQPFTQEQRTRLLASLEAVRRHGVAETCNIAASGIAAVAAPVEDACGKLLLAIGCSAPMSRADAGRRARMRAATTRTAEAMTTDLAGRNSEQ